MEERKNKNHDRRPRQPRRDARPDPETAENLLEGRNALTEALAAGRAIDKVYLAEGNTDRALARLAAMAKQAGAVVVETDRRKLDQLSATGAHQGVIAVVAAHDYSSVDDIFARAAEKGEPPLIVLCDELSDPHTSAPSSAPPNVRAHTASSFPSAAALDSPPSSARRPPVRWSICPSPAFRIWSIRSKS